MEVGLLIAWFLIGFIIAFAELFYSSQIENCDYIVLTVDDLTEILCASICISPIGILAVLFTIYRIYTNWHKKHKDDIIFRRKI